MSAYMDYRIQLLDYEFPNRSSYILGIAYSTAPNVPLPSACKHSMIDEMRDNLSHSNMFWVSIQNDLRELQYAPPHVDHGTCTD
jgi:hypothetical protein